MGNFIATRFGTKINQNHSTKSHEIRQRRRQKRLYILKGRTCTPAEKFVAAPLFWIEAAQFSVTSIVPSIRRHQLSRLQRGPFLEGLESQLLL